MSSVEPKNTEVTIEEVEAVISKITVENVIDISWENQKLSYQINDGFTNGFTISASGDEVCRGSGYSFARCVKKALDDGKTLKVYKEGNEYVAEETEEKLVPTPR